LFSNSLSSKIASMIFLIAILRLLFIDRCIVSTMADGSISTPNPSISPATFSVLTTPASRSISSLGTQSSILPSTAMPPKQDEPMREPMNPSIKVDAGKVKVNTNPSAPQPFPMALNANPDMGKEIANGLISSLGPDAVGGGTDQNAMAAFGLLPTISKLSTPISNWTASNGHPTTSPEKKADVGMQQQVEDNQTATLWTAIVLGIVGFFTLVLIIGLCWRRQRNRRLKAAAQGDNRRLNLENSSTPNSAIIDPESIVQSMTVNETVEEREIGENQLNADISRNLRVAPSISQEETRSQREACTQKRVRSSANQL